MIIEDRNRLPEALEQIPDEKLTLAARDHYHDEPFTTEPIGFYRDAMRRLYHNRVSMASLSAILIIVILAIVVPMVSGYSYVGQNVEQKHLPPKIPLLANIGIADGTRVMTNRKKSSISDTSRFPEGSVIEIIREYKVGKQDVVDVKVDYYKYCGVPEDEYHWFGTDYLGRDILTRLFHGARISLLISLLSVLTNLIIGIIYGSVAGYYGGKVDMFLTHLAEVLDGLPYLVVTILFMLLLGSGMFSIILAKFIPTWTLPSASLAEGFFSVPALSAAACLWAACCAII